MSLPLVKIENVSAFYPGILPRKAILEDIHWQIGSGEHCALFGPNGAGKSSLLKLLHGVLWPASGTIRWLADKDYSDSPITGKEITGLVSPEIQANCQKHGWNVTVRDILAGARTDSPYSFTASDAELAEAENLMAEFGADSYLQMRLPELSQGQLRLVLLARELLRQPSLLLLDEWSEGLDQEKQRLVLNKLESLESEITMIFALHRRGSLPGWVEKHIYIDAGKFTGKPTYIQLPAQAEKQTRNAPPDTGRLIFDLKSVSVYIDSHPVLHNINWQMREGENWQISGTNGSGKSTFLRLLAGDEFIHAGGSLQFWPRGAKGPAVTLDEKRHAISLVSDLGQALYGYEITALELILSGLDNSIGLHREFDAHEIRWAVRLLEEFFPENAAAIARQSIRRLSSGQLRRLFLARAMATMPEVLLLDEPLSSLDRDSEMRYLDTLAQLIDQGIHGSQPQIVIVSHQALPDIFNRHGIMAGGHLGSTRCRTV